MEPIDIHEPVFEICKRLNLDPNDVFELTLMPMEVRAELKAGVYKKNKNGKYVEDGKPVTKELHFKVTT